MQNIVFILNEMSVLRLFEQGERKIPLGVSHEDGYYGGVDFDERTRSDSKE